MFKWYDMDVYLSKKQSIPQTTWIVPFLFIAFTSLFGEGLTCTAYFNPEFYFVFDKSEQKSMEYEKT